MASYLRDQILSVHRVRWAIPGQVGVEIADEVREVSYVHEDEARALDERAKKERASKSEIIRRALRAYPGIED
jgi:hypothetical protein